MKYQDNTTVSQGVAENVSPQRTRHIDGRSDEDIVYSHGEGKHVLKFPLRTGYLLGFTSALLLAFVLALTLL